MKTLEQLGISPAPWKVRDGSCDVMSGSRFVVSNAYDTAEDLANARLIAAAPYLCECLREAVIEMCNRACENRVSECAKTERECYVAKWRKALEKAGGAQ